MKKINESGFSLTEIMIVLGILTILSVMAIPDIKGWLPKYRLKAAARQIVSDMQLARYRAIGTNTRHGIYFQTANSYQLYSDTNNPPASYDSNDTIEKNVLLHQSIICNPNRNPINFLPLGTATAATVTIQNEKGQTSSIKVLGTTGRIRIE